MGDKAFGVSVEGYSSWFFFDFYENVVWFMELCAEEGRHSSAYRRNELGQYEQFVYYKFEDE